MMRRLDHSARVRYCRIRIPHGCGVRLRDFDKGIEVIQAATVYTNANETFNDGKYEYDEMLFVSAGSRQAIYEIESRRERRHVPDLGRFSEIND